MKLIPAIQVLVVVLVSFTFETCTTMKHFGECTQYNCNGDNNVPNDIIDEFYDLLFNIEQNSNETFQLPDFELLFSFSGGTFSYDYDDNCYTCMCPLRKKGSKYFVTFLEYFIADYKYNWILPRTNLSGQFEIASEVFYNIYLLNETDHIPKIKGINITELNIFSWWFEGLPLEWLEKIPDDVFKKAVTIPLKPFIENKVMIAYEEGIKKIFGGLGKQKKNYGRFHSDDAKPHIISKALKLKSKKRPYRLPSPKYSFE